MQTIQVGEFYSVDVIKILPYGVIVDVPTLGKTELIYKSKISNHFVNVLSDYVNIGDNLIAECVVGQSILSFRLIT